MPEVMLYHDARFLQHRTGRHPECPDRLQSIANMLTGSGLDNRCLHGQTVAATKSQLLRVHTPEHCISIAEAVQSQQPLDADTPVSRASDEIARLAAGTAMAAVDRVLQAESPQDVRRACCLLRPPGHHATPTHAMGFCLYNNVAVAARHAVAAHGLNRVLIVDWDVHHGNGTQDAFFADEQVTFFSVHRSPFYPGSGAVHETGTGAGLGTTFNLPLSFGTSRAEFLSGFRNVFEDALTRCQPELILISAGFDAHHADPVGSLGLETEDFGVLTQEVIAAATQHCDGRIVSLLEGGYNLQALADSVQCHLETLLTTG